MNLCRIGITNCGRFENYANWIREIEGTEVIKLGYDNKSFNTINQCEGILLTGGQDVHPRFYDRMEYMDYYKGTIPDIDEQRDEFELEVLRYSQQHKLPLLGICRGLQLANVFFGGTLVLDIPSMGMRNHSKIKEGEDRYHNISVTPGSVLQKITGSDAGTVNSAHHQSALNIADVLTVNAMSDDGVIEGLERKDFYNHPYLMLVQWHPERMTDQRSEFSFNVRKSFLNAVRNEVPAI